MNKIPVSYYKKLKADYSNRELSYDELSFIHDYERLTTWPQSAEPQSAEPQVNMSRSGLAEYLSTLHWGAFFTSTFEPKIDNYEVCSNNQRVLKRPMIRYSALAIDKVERALTMPRLRPTKMFIAAEQFKLGGWHTHGLLEFPDTKHRDELVMYQRNNLKSLGYNLVSSVGSLDACSVYLSKYLTKDEYHGDWRMTGRKKFWQSSIMVEA